jgi:hypothetical protein
VNLNFYSNLNYNSKNVYSNLHNCVICDLDGVKIKVKTELAFLINAKGFEPFKYNKHWVFGDIRNKTQLNVTLKLI